MFYVYVLECNGDCYIGFTSDLRSRFTQHNEGRNTSTKVGDGRFSIMKPTDRKRPRESANVF